MLLFELIQLASSCDENLPGNAMAIGALIDNLDWEENIRNNLW